MDEIYKIIGQNLFYILITLIPGIVGIGIYVNKVNNLQKEVDRIRKILDDNSSFGGIVKKKSPLSLTEKGQKILKESGAQDYIDRKKSDLIIEVQDKNPKSLYDIQEFSGDIIKNHTSDDDFIPIKDYTYKNGLVLDHIIMGMAVYLRDLIIPQWEADKK